MKTLHRSYCVFLTLGWVTFFLLALNWLLGDDGFPPDSVSFLFPLIFFVAAIVLYVVKSALAEHEKVHHRK